MLTAEYLEKVVYFILRLVVVGCTFMGLELSGLVTLSPYLYFFIFLCSIFICFVHILLYLSGKYVAVGYVIVPPIYIFVYQFASIRNIVGHPTSEVQLQFKVVMALLLLAILVSIARFALNKNSSK